MRNQSIAHSFFVVNCCKFEICFHACYGADILPSCRFDYGNQAGVARALQKFPDQAVFVITKIPGCGVDSVRNGTCGHGKPLAGLGRNMASVVTLFTACFSE